MTTPERIDGMAAAADGARQFTISVGAIAWAAFALAFLGLRLGVTWQAPVGGAELVHLSGAWQAAQGIDDPRFVPTLFQAFTALLLKFSSSEVPARILAYAVTASVPAALYLLRRPLGEAGALIALLLLALDPVGIWQGVVASASATDIALSLWLLVLLDRKRPEAWIWGASGFMLATAGPMPALLGASALAVTLARGRSLDRMAGLAGGIGAGLGVAGASVGFGFGVQGLAIPPLELLSDAFSHEATTASVIDGVSLYAWPVLLLGLAGAAFRVSSRARGLSAIHLVLLAWFGVGLAWVVVSAGTNDLLPLTVATTPAALLAGPYIAAAVASAIRADWAYPRFVLPAAGYAVLVAFAVMERWGKLGRVKSGEEALVVALLFAAVAAGLAGLAVQRASRPVLPLAGVVFLVPILFAGAFGVALSGVSEPLPSPFVSSQSSVLRELARSAASEQGGVVVIHPEYADQATWAFRDVPGVVITADIPVGAAVVIWPLALPNPDGYLPVSGDWALLREVRPATDDPLEYLNWYSDRNGAITRNQPVAVYTGAPE